MKARILYMLDNAARHVRDPLETPVSRFHHMGPVSSGYFGGSFLHLTESKSSQFAGAERGHGGSSRTGPAPSMEPPEFGEPSSLGEGAAFRRRFGLPVRTQPAIPDRDRSRLALEAIAEGLHELSDAFEREKLVNVAEALATLQVLPLPPPRTTTTIPEASPPSQSSPS